jgi:ketosteroid isomerase-like protein
MRPLTGFKLQWRRTLAGAACLAATMAAPAAQASDACAARAIRTLATVEVSDGSAFTTETFFRSADQAVIRHRDETLQTVAVEGPLAWISRGDKARLGDDALKRFAMGHQYHALLLHFDELVEGVRPRPDLNFGGVERPARGGGFPHGGTVYEVAGDDPSRPLGMRFELPETPPIEVRFGDWRAVGGHSLPYLVQVDDSSLRFDYRYEEIELDDRPPGWLQEEVTAPDLDALRIYRLHREILAAHCAGDAGRIATRTAPEIVVASNGELHHSTSDATLQRFTSTFQRLDYQTYVDLVEPALTVAESGDLGWIAVQVRAGGTVADTGEPFDSQWAWIMLTRKIDGVWMNAGNAANRVVPPATGK